MNREHNGALGLKTNTQYDTMPDKYAMDRFYEDKKGSTFIVYRAFDSKIKCKIKPMKRYKVDGFAILLKYHSHAYLKHLLIFNFSFKIFNHKNICRTALATLFLLNAKKYKI